MLRTIARTVSYRTTLNAPWLSAGETEDAEDMTWRIVGGLGGWLMSLAPLVIVNALAFATAIDPSVVPIAGGVALIVGIALGGLLAGLLGGRSGGWGGAVAGAIAAALFAATLIALMYDLRAQHQLPYLLALHPLRAMGAIGFIACLVMAVATLAGIAPGRRRARRLAAASQPGRASVAQSSPRAGAGPRSDLRRPAQSAPRDQSEAREARRTVESHARQRSPRR